MFSGTNDQVWKRGYGGGVYVSFGIPFLLGGLYFLSEFFGNLGVKEVDDDATRPVVNLLFGVIFAAFGGALVFGRTGLEINLLNRTAKYWWGLLQFPLRREEYSLADFNRITLAMELRTKKGSTYTDYAVRLTGQNHEMPLESWRSYEAARKQCEEVSQFCGLPISDCVDEIRRRQSEDTDLPLRPAAMQTKIEFRDDEVIFEFPSRGGGRIEIVGCLLCLVIPLGLVSYFYLLPMFQGKNGFPGTGHILIALFVLAGFFKSLFTTLLEFVRGPSEFLSYRIRIIASPDQFTFEHVSAHSTRTITIRSDQIVELELPPLGLPSEEEMQQSPRMIREWGRRLFEATRSIVVRSDDSQRFTFATGLPEEEQEYVHALLVKTLM